MKRKIFKKTLSVLLAALCFPLAGFFSGCKDANTEPVNDTVTKNGVIRYYAPPDNCNDYVFTTTDDNSEFDLIFKPDALSEEFKIDSLNVRVTYTVTDQEHDCGFGGKISIINILNIERL